MIVILNGDSTLISTVGITTDEDGLETHWRQWDAFGTLSFSRTTQYDERDNIVRIIDNYSMNGIYEYQTTWECEN